MLQRLSIRHVMIGAMAAVSLVAFACVVALLLTSSSMGRYVESQADRLVRDEDVADRIVLHVQHQLAAAERYLITGDPQHLQQFRDEGHAVYDQIRTFLFRDPGTVERLLVERIRERHQAIEVAAQRVFATRDATGAVAELPGIRELQSDLVAFIELRRAETARALHRQQAVWRWLYLACGVLGLAFGAATVVAGGFLRRRLLEPLHALARAARRVGAGDFDARVEFRGHDELAAVAASFNSMAERLQQARHDAGNAEEALRHSEARFRSLIENASEGVLILSAEGLITYQSPAVERMLGYPAHETLGRSPFELVHPEDLGAVQESFVNVMTPEGHGKSVEFRCRTFDGSWRTLHVSGADLRHDPAVNGIVVNMIDSTTHRSLEEQLHHSQRLEAVGRLAGGIAHDFNNLLTAMRGYTDLLGDKLQDDTRAYADVVEVRRAVERAARLTRQLLAFSRRQVVRPQATNLASVIAEIERMLRRLITEEIPLTTTISGPAWVFADPGQLEQIVVNLVVNARDARPRSGIRVSVETATLTGMSAAIAGVDPGDYVVLTIGDDGAGIEPDVLPHIFEPFFTTKDVGRGTGLGLSTVYGIVQDAGGVVRAESAVGAGTRIMVYLPRIDAPASDSGIADEGAAAAVEQGTELILLVEDEVAVRSLAERILLRQGYHVITAGSGVEGLEVAQTIDGSIDLLVTDVVMPEMGGIELATRLLDARPETRVLFISGYAADTVPITDANGRTMYFLEKPFSPARFAETIRRILDEAVQPA